MESSGEKRCDGTARNDTFLVLEVEGRQVAGPAFRLSTPVQSDHLLPSVAYIVYPLLSITVRCKPVRWDYRKGKRELERG